MEVRNLNPWMAREALPFYSKYEGSRSFPGGSAVKNLLAMQETQFQSLSGEDPLEEGMATHSRILARKTLSTEETGRLQSIGSQRVRRD